MFHNDFEASIAFQTKFCVWFRWSFWTIIYGDTSDQQPIRYKSFSAKEIRGRGIGKPGGLGQTRGEQMIWETEQRTRAPLLQWKHISSRGRTLTLHSDRRPLALSPGSPSPPRWANIHSAKSINILSLYSSKKKLSSNITIILFYFKKTIYRILQSPTSLRLLDHSDRRSLCSGFLEGGKWWRCGSGAVLWNSFKLQTL